LVGEEIVDGEYNLVGGFAMRWRNPFGFVFE
jgi:hypothetical protein